MAATAQKRKTHGRLSWFPAFLRLLAHPELWATGLVQLGRLARPGWWRRPPYLPVPDRGYLRFRFETAYGSEGGPRAGDLVAYLRWCRDRRR